MVFVEQGGSQDGENASAKIHLPFDCNVYKFNSDNIENILKYKDTPVKGWRNVTRNVKNYCINVIAGIVHYHIVYLMLLDIFLS